MRIERWRRSFLRHRRLCDLERLVRLGCGVTRARSCTLRAYYLPMPMPGRLLRATPRPRGGSSTPPPNDHGNARCVSSMPAPAWRLRSVVSWPWFRRGRDARVQRPHRNRLYGCLFMRPLLAQGESENSGRSHGVSTGCCVTRHRALTADRHGLHSQPEPPSISSMVDSTWFSRTI